MLLKQAEQVELVVLVDLQVQVVQVVMLEHQVQVKLQAHQDLQDLMVQVVAQLLLIKMQVMEELPH